MWVSEEERRYHAEQDRRWAEVKQKGSSAPVKQKSMNQKADAAATKIMLAFEPGGLVPLDLHQFAVIDAHVRSILGRAMETKKEKSARKWAKFQKVKQEAGDRWNPQW